MITTATTDIYELLLDKMDTLGKGYPRTEKGTEVNFLKKLFNERDAQFFIQMRNGLHSVAETAHYMGISEEEAQENLERMASDHLIFWHYDAEKDLKRYRPIPFVHGLWELNADKVELEDAIDRVHHFANGFGESLFDYRIPIVRAVPTRPDTVKKGDLLPLDDVRENIKAQELIIVADCVCRYSGKFGGECDCMDNINVCMMFGDMAQFYLEEKVANTHKLSVEEALALVDENERRGFAMLVGHTSTYSAMCSCPSCHCGLIKSAKIAAATGPKHRKTAHQQWGNYRCIKDDDACIDCGVCIERCPMDAFSADEDGQIAYESSRCIGCGLCVTTCPTDALLLERKPDEELNLPEDDLAYDAFDRMAREKIVIDKERRELAQDTGVAA